MLLNFRHSEDIRHKSKCALSNTKDSENNLGRDLKFFNIKAKEKAPRVKVPMTSLEDLSSIPRTHMIEGQK